MFVSWDPIAYNPLIKVYRKLAKNVRTEDEHPLTMKDIREIRSFFPKSEFSAYWLTTLAIFLKFYLIDGVDPNKERYWKKIVTDEKELRPLYNRLKRVDDILLSVCPPLKWLCWNAVLICGKD